MDKTKNNLLPEDCFFEFYYYYYCCDDLLIDQKIQFVSSLPDHIVYNYNDCMTKRREDN